MYMYFFWEEIATSITYIHIELCLEKFLHKSQSRHQMHIVKPLPPPHPLFSSSTWSLPFRLFFYKIPNLHHLQAPTILRCPNPISKSLALAEPFCKIIRIAFLVLAKVKIWT